MGQILIKDVPEDVRRYIYNLQVELRLQRGGTTKYSQSAVIIKLLKKQMALDNKKKKEDD